MTTKVTVRKGSVYIPDDLRGCFGIEESMVLLSEASPDGTILRPDDTEIVNGFEIETYTPERKAEFFLNNAMDAYECAWAREEVKRMGLDPDTIPHVQPSR